MLFENGLKIIISVFTSIVRTKDLNLFIKRSLNLLVNLSKNRK